MRNGRTHPIATFVLVVVIGVAIAIAANDYVRGHVRAAELSVVEQEFSAREIVGRRYQVRQFGYDVFQSNAFARPLGHAPISPFYVLGPGDELIVSITGRQEQEYRLIVDRDGMVNLPQVGVISIWGLTFEEAAERITSEINKYFTEVRIRVSAGSLRSIGVFVLGEVNRPGRHDLEGLSTVLHGLFAAGGIERTGSLRRVQLIRGGEVAAVFDLYDLLLKGSRQNDVLLQDEDVIFVPPIGPVAAIAGEVARPGIYELSGGETLADLVHMAGGLNPAAAVSEIYLDRVEGHVRRSLQRLSYSHVQQLMADEEQAVRDADFFVFPDVRVANMPDRTGQVIAAAGVVQPGSYPLGPEATVSDLLAAAGGVDAADVAGWSGYILRFVSHDRRVELTFDVGRALQGEPSDDLPLQPWDIVTLQPPAGDAGERWIEVRGAVGRPGRYPFDAGMTVADVLTAAGGLQPGAYLPRAELYRPLVEGSAEAFAPEGEPLRVISVDLTRIGEDETSPSVQAGDRLVVYGEGYRAWLPTVAIYGEVRHPGTFEFVQGTRLSGLFYRAGGPTDRADLQRVEIYRPHYGSGRQVEVIRVSLHELQTAAQLVALDPERDLVLEPGDQVYVRAAVAHDQPRVVSLTGEVRYPGTYRITPGERLSSVIQRAGGFTDDAYPFGLVFTRVAERQRQAEFVTEFVRAERERVARERARLESLPLTSDERERRWRALDYRAELLDLLESRGQQGRIVLDLEGTVIAGTPADLRLQHGDRIEVPPYPETVAVLGAVYGPGAFVYDAAASVEDYVRLAGGPLPEADAEGLYVIKANGRVETARTGLSAVRQGDIIVIPSRLDPLWLVGEAIGPKDGGRAENE